MWPAVILASLLVWFGGLALSLRRRRPEIKPAGGIPDAGLVSVIVPARNEEQVIGRCLASLLAQDYGRLEVLVVDDNSRDGTAQKVRDFIDGSGRVRLLSCPEPGPGWVGKNIACLTGARNARGRWLLFVDADVSMARGMVSAALAYMEGHGVDVLSLVPRLESVAFPSRFTLPVIGFLIRVFYPLEGVNRGMGKAFLYGGFALFRADAYWRIGGHEAVRGELVEDKALGELAQRRGLRVRVLVGRRMLTAQVGGRGFGEMWLSIQRVASTVFRGKRLAAALFSLLLPLVFWLPHLSLIGALLQGSAAMFSLALLSLAAQSATLLTDVSIDQDAHPLHVLLTPLGALIVGISVLSWALVHPREVVWKGRRYGVG